MKRLPGVRVCVVLVVLAFWPAGVAVSSPPVTPGPPLTPSPTPQRSGTASTVLSDVSRAYNQLDSEIALSLQKFSAAVAGVAEMNAQLAALAQQIQKLVELKKKLAEIKDLLSTAEHETASKLTTALGNLELKAKTELDRISRVTPVPRTPTRTPTRPPGPAVT